MIYLIQRLLQELELKRKEIFAVMRNSMTRKKLKMRVLRRISKRTELGRMEYRLCGICGIGAGEGYAIEVRTREERERRYVGADASFANMIFEKTVRNSVTPCTLGDITEDEVARCVSFVNGLLNNQG